MYCSSRTERHQHHSRGLLGVLHDIRESHHEEPRERRHDRRQRRDLRREIRGMRRFERRGRSTHLPLNGADGCHPPQRVPPPFFGSNGDACYSHHQRPGLIRGTVSLVSQVLQQGHRIVHPVSNERNYVPPVATDVTPHTPSDGARQPVMGIPMSFYNPQ